MCYLTDLPWLKVEERAALEPKIESAFEVQDRAEIKLADLARWSPLDSEEYAILKSACGKLGDWLDCAQHQALEPMSRINRERSMESHSAMVANTIKRAREDNASERRANFKIVT